MNRLSLTKNFTGVKVKMKGGDASKMEKFPFASVYNSTCVNLKGGKPYNNIMNARLK